MILEKILFPAPNPPHYTLTSHRENLFWIPSDEYSTETPSIPCMLYSPSRDARLFIIWCHGNGCDIGSMDKTWTALSRRLQAHVLIFEYPSYGLLIGNTSSPSEASINNHAQCAYAFVRDTFKWPTDRIIIYGHSIGSGPACHLASTQPVGGLILLSPFTSIKNLIQEKIGFLLSNVVSRSFWDNYEAMTRITCPTLFIHGQRDNLIPSKHSEILYDSFKHTNNKHIVLLPNDDHNWITDSIMLMHVEPFINKYFQPTTIPMLQIRIDPILRQPPPLNFKSGSNFFSSLLSSSKNATASVSS
jgi:fermentation-respiration switch protein FrsA (DUF1100 family)